ncbi:uncharacterized protein LOC130625698 isoform X1 [Hydractinia symbiolongicarpus]|uniref:uncharacterized protein LOC130625698 isoform X1 n=1 Tax=Hydractinia symbiolongicarpus TaxID=13093 RepID=UPI00254FC34E|nr:uncharacterized protein LOC130625698 isoform X1 [Hydractinia symbiolongicarpus]
MRHTMWNYEFVVTCVNTSKFPTNKNSDEYWRRHFKINRPSNEKDWCKKRCRKEYQQCESVFKFNIDADEGNEIGAGMCKNWDKQCNSYCRIYQVGMKPATVRKFDRHAIIIKKGETYVEYCKFKYMDCKRKAISVNGNYQCIRAWTRCRFDCMKYKKLMGIHPNNNNVCQD